MSFLRITTAFLLHLQKFVAEVMVEVFLKFFRGKWVIFFCQRLIILTPPYRTTLLERIDHLVRNDEDIEKALDFVDQEVLVSLLGINPTICKQARSIWKKMQKRRLGRG